jgi:hypothetical protein
MASGTLIAESLRLGVPVEALGLEVTRVERVGPLQGVPPEQPAIWTFLEFRIDDDRAGGLADDLAGALADGPWYCDLRTERDTLVVFAGRVFRYPRGEPEGRQLAGDHARSVGIPESQIDWPE